MTIIEDKCPVGCKQNSIKATDIEWRKHFQFSHLDEIAKLIILDSDELYCIICGREFSPRFTGKIGYLIHLKHWSHIKSTIQFYMNNYFTGSKMQ
jgi:hypothetical protein